MPANPTFDECMTQLGKAVQYVNARDLYGNANTPNVLGLYDDLVTSLDGEFVTGAVAILDADRQQVSNLLRPGGLRQLFTPFMREAAQAIGDTGAGDYNYG